MKQSIPKDHIDTDIEHALEFAKGIPDAAVAPTLHTSMQEFANSMTQALVAARVVVGAVLVALKKDKPDVKVAAIQDGEGWDITADGVHVLSIMALTEMDASTATASLQLKLYPQAMNRITSGAQKLDDAVSPNSDNSGLN